MEIKTNDVFPVAAGHIGMVVHGDRRDDVFLPDDSTDNNIIDITGFPSTAKSRDPFVLL